MASSDASAAIEAVLAQLTAAQSGGAGGGSVSSDALTRAILERLNDEVAKVYAEAGGADDDGGRYDSVSGMGSPEMSASRRSGTGSTVQMPNRPRPVELWNAAHLVERSQKQKTALTAEGWGELVTRMNERAKRSHEDLRKAQHEAAAAQLAGLTFVPTISERSRELASANKALPERVAALMRKKKAKLDSIRMEREKKELAEATFKPTLNRRAHDGEDGDSGPRVGHLLQYEIDRRVRADQRKALIADMESRDTTFKPSINRNSQRIVERLRTAAPPEEAAASLLKSSSKLLAGGGGGGSPSGERKLRPGLSWLPGHEEETFQPRINARSKNLLAARSGAGAAAGAGAGEEGGASAGNVYSRLYSQGAGGAASAATAAGAGGVAGSGAASPGGGGGEELEGDAGGGGDRSSPRYFNTIAHDSTGRHDFILRRLVSTGGGLS